MEKKIWKRTDTITESELRKLLMALQTETTASSTGSTMTPAQVPVVHPHYHRDISVSDNFGSNSTIPTVNQCGRHR